MKKNGTLEKCETCKIAHETPDMACCAWYMDNVVCGDKTTEDCTEYLPCNKEEAVSDMWRKIRDAIQMMILTFTMVGGFFLGYLYIWAGLGLPMERYALIVAMSVSVASTIGWQMWIKYGKR